MVNTNRVHHKVEIGLNLLIIRFITHVIVFNLGIVFPC